MTPTCWQSTSSASRTRGSSTLIAVVDSDQLKATTVVNALELASLMSIAQSGVKARELFNLLHRRRDLQVLYWRSWPDQPVFVARALEYVAARRSPLVDALIGWILEENGVELLVTWNTRHYSGRYPFEVATPEQYFRPAEPQLAAAV